MSLYDWPPGGGGGGDDPGGRGDFLQRHRAELDAEGARRIARRGPQPRPGVLRAPANGRSHLWQPLGPHTVIDGQVVGGARVAGRVNMLAVHPDGQRLYAASANGGVWHSADGGLHWRSLGGLAATPSPGSINRPAQRNACGAIAVDWSAAGGEVVYVGTGETTHRRDAQSGSSLGGIGILHAVAPAASAADDPWSREADVLLGQGVCRIALEPGGSGVVAATTTGLFERTVSGSWQRLAAAPFDTLETKCADVLWTAGDGARPKRLWVWVQGGGSSGLWVRDGTGTFQRILTTQSPTAAALGEAVTGRATFAIANPLAAPDQIYLFNDHGKRDGSGVPRLFRIACSSAAAPTARSVTGVPDVLGSQGFYDIALAVHPAQGDRVVVGGSTFPATTPSGEALRDTGNANAGAIVIADVADDGSGTLVFGLPATPSRMVGAGVHADVHHLVFSNSGNRLWAACDGGVFRSDRLDSQVGFAAMNDGLSVVESNHIACHPVCEGLVVAGLQDNGVIRRRSGAVWFHEGDGDGGGVAFDPTRPTRYLRQDHEGIWKWCDGDLALPWRVVGREENSAFYSTPALVAKQRPGAPAGRQRLTQLIIGTSRLWYSEDSGANWVTLPSATLPPAGDLNQDDFGQKITVCRWQGSEVAWVLGEGRLRRYARTAGTDNAAGPGTWTAETVIERGVKNKKDETKANGPIRDAEVWTDIAVNLDALGTAHGTRGALYLGTIGHAEDEAVDTLWWFDGTERWFATELRSKGVPAPVTSIVCDPDLPDEVWVGTTIGVWKGVRNLADPAAPSWTWSARVNGLPEAAVEDLVLFSRDGLRLLRAGIASRGVWELRLDTADVADLAYLRVHEDDLRHRASASLLGRDGTTERSWHASPDVRPRCAALAVPPPPTLPWTRGSLMASDTEALRRFQSALRARTGDPRVRATAQWDAHFNEVLRSLGAPIIAPQTVRIDQGYWNLSMVTPFATAEPWGAGRPSSADLIEFSAPLEEGTADRVSCTLPAGPSRVEVLVQHRGLAPMDGADVRVALLQWVDPQTPLSARFDDASTWPAGDVPWSAGVNEVLNSAAGTTALALGAGWSLVGPRQTLAGQTIEALRPGVASFEVDFSALRRDRVVLLVAVIRQGGDLVLAPAPLRTLALEHAQVAVRSLAIIPALPLFRGPVAQLLTIRSLRADGNQASLARNDLIEYRVVYGSIFGDTLATQGLVQLKISLKANDGTSQNYLHFRAPAVAADAAFQRSPALSVQVVSLRSGWTVDEAIELFLALHPLDYERHLLLVHDNDRSQTIVCAWHLAIPRADGKVDLQEVGYRLISEGLVIGSGVAKEKISLPAAAPAAQVYTPLFQHKVETGVSLPPNSNLGRKTGSIPAPVLASRRAFLSEQQVTLPEHGLALLNRYTARAGSDALRTAIETAWRADVTTAGDLRNNALGMARSGYEKIFYKLLEAEPTPAFASGITPEFVKSTFHQRIRLVHRAYVDYSTYLASRGLSTLQVPVEAVWALYRIEGALNIPPSLEMLKRGIPPIQLALQKIIVFPKEIDVGGVMVRIEEDFIGDLIVLDESKLVTAGVVPAGTSLFASISSGAAKSVIDRVRQSCLPLYHINLLAMDIYVDPNLFPFNERNSRYAFVKTYLMTRKALGLTLNEDLAREAFAAWYRMAGLLVSCRKGVAFVAVREAVEMASFWLLEAMLHFTMVRRRAAITGHVLAHDLPLRLAYLRFNFGEVSFWRIVNIIVTKAHSSIVALPVATYPPAIRTFLEQVRDDLETDLTPPTLTRLKAMADLTGQLSGDLKRRQQDTRANVATFQAVEDRLLRRDTPTAGELAALDAVLPGANESALLADVNIETGGRFGEIDALIAWLDANNLWAGLDGFFATRELDDLLIAFIRSVPTIDRTKANWRWINLFRYEQARRYGHYVSGFNRIFS